MLRSRKFWKGQSEKFYKGRILYLRNPGYEKHYFEIIFCLFMFRLNVQLLLLGVRQKQLSPDHVFMNKVFHCNRANM